MSLIAYYPFTDTKAKYQSMLDVEWYDIAGIHSANGHPLNQAEMDDFFDSSLSGVEFRGRTTYEGSVDWGDSNNYPDYLPDDYFSWRANGLIYCPEAGTYTFGIDGDDAIDLSVDGVLVASWYGGHGFVGNLTTHTGTISLTEGYHRIVIRHEEGAGGAGIAVGWQKPSDTSIAIIPGTAFYRDRAEENAVMPPRLRIPQTVSYEQGNPGKCIRMNSETVEFESVPAISSRQISIAFWADVTSLTSNRVCWTEGQGGVRATNIHLIYNNGNTYWDAGGVSTYDRIFKANPSPTTGWKHWVFTKNVDTGIMNIYLNGELWHTGSGNFIPIDAQTVVPGNGLAANLAGALSDFRIYDHELSQVEIDELSQAKVLHYDFNTFIEPTSNLFPEQLRQMSGTSGWTLSSHAGISNAFLTNVFGRDHVIQVTNTAGSDSDWYSRYNCPFSTTVGEQYVFARDYRVEVGTAIPNNPVLYQDGWKVGGQATRVQLFDIDLGDGWRRIAYQFTITTAGTPVLRMSTGYTTEEWELYMDNFQFERKGHATPFVDGDRDGVVYDASGHENDATLELSSTPQWVEDSAWGTGAYRFNGVDQFIDTGMYLDKDDFTYAAWAYFDSVSGTHRDIIDCIEPTSTNWARLGTQNTDPVFIVDIGGTRVDAQGTTPLSTGVWYHLVGVREGTENRIYVNGVLEGTGACPAATIPGIVSENIGSNGSGTNEFHEGLITDVRIYKYALTQDEITELFNNRGHLDKYGHYYTNEFNAIDDSSTWHTITAESAGILAGNYFRAKIDGVDYASGETRGINVARFGPDLSYIALSNFDTYSDDDYFIENGTTVTGTSIASAALVNYLKQVPLGDYLCIGTFDSAVATSSAVVDLLESWGSEWVQYVPGNNRCSWALIVHVGYGKIGPESWAPVSITHGVEVSVSIPERHLLSSSVQTSPLFREQGNYAESDYLDYHTWVPGTTGSQPGGWSQNGSTSENAVEYYESPWGVALPSWICIPDSGSNADGGWDAGFSGSNTERLRMTVFVKRTGSNNGSTYHGCSTSNTLNLNGTSNTNPYFWSGDPPTLDEWYLMVGIVHPNSYTGGDSGVSGMYDMQGNKVIDFTEYKWGTGSGQQMRNYLYYCTDTNVRQYFLFPRTDVVDGTEPTLEQLLSGYDVALEEQLGTTTKMRQRKSGIIIRGDYHEV